MLDLAFDLIPAEYQHEHDRSNLEQAGPDKGGGGATSHASGALERERPAEQAAAERLLGLGARPAPASAWGNKRTGWIVGAKPVPWARS